MGKHKGITLEELKRHSRVLSMKMQLTLAKVVKTTEKTEKLAERSRQFKERCEENV